MTSDLEMRLHKMSFADVLYQNSLEEQLPEQPNEKMGVTLVMMLSGTMATRNVPIQNYQEGRTKIETWKQLFHTSVMPLWRCDRASEAEPLQWDTRPRPRRLRPQKQ